MRIFKNRPLALGCLIYLVLLYISYGRSSYVFIAEMCVGAFCAALILILNLTVKKDFIKNLTVYLIPIVLAFLLCGAVSLCTFHIDKEKALQYDGIKDTYEILVEEIEYESDSLSGYIGYIEELDVRVLLLTYGDEAELGDKLISDVEISAIRNLPYGYDAKSMYIVDGVYLQAQCNDFEISSRENYNLKIYLRKVNSDFNSIIRDRVNSDTAPIISALFLGNKGEIYDNDSRDFARLGISHILVLSGMHLSIIAAFVGYLFSKTRLRRQLRYILTILAVWMFAGLTGFSESVLRAAIMLTIFYAFFLVRIRADFITRIFVSVTLICIISPYSVFSIGLLLSFLAVIGCVISGEIIKSSEKRSKLRLIPMAMVTTVVIVLFTLPVTFLKFGLVSTVSPIANLILIPMFTVLLYLSPFVLIFGGIPIIGNGICFVCEQIVGLILFITRNTAHLKFVAIPFNSTLHVYAVIIIFAAFVAFLVLGKKQRRYCYISILIGVCLFTCGSVVKSVELHRNNYVYSHSTSDSDYTYLESNGGITVIDNSEISKASSSSLYAEIIDTGYLEIENYIITDYTRYMYDAIDRITDITYVRNVYLPEPMDESEREEYDRIFALLSQKNINVYKISDKIDLNEVKITFAPYEKLSRSTKRLVVYCIEGETSRYTYIGASVYEGARSYRYAQGFINASDAVYFGAYGPKFLTEFKFDLSQVEHCIMAEGAKAFSSCNIDTNEILSSEQRFILR